MKKLTICVTFWSIVTVLYAGTTVIWDTGFEEKDGYTLGQQIISFTGDGAGPYKTIRDSWDGYVFNSQWLVVACAQVTDVSFGSDGAHLHDLIPATAFTNGVHEISFDILHLGLDTSAQVWFYGLPMFSGMGPDSVGFDGFSKKINPNLGDIFHLSCVFDLDAKCFSAWIDGECFVEGFILPDDAALTSVRFTTGRGSDLWGVGAMDNFYWSVTTVDAIPEPATLSLLLLGGGALLARRRRG